MNMRISAHGSAGPHRRSWYRTALPTVVWTALIACVVTYLPGDAAQAKHKKSVDAKIQSPLANASVPRHFVATGPAFRHVKRVLAYLDNSADATVKPQYGITLREPPATARWLTYFNVPTADIAKYNRLTIIEGGSSPKNPRILDSIPIAQIKQIKKRPKVVTVVFPDNNSTWCTQNFLSYGTHDTDDTALVSATMTYVDGSSMPTVTPADYIFDDPSSGFWCAQFDTLPQNADGTTYTFTATGNGGGQDQKTGLMLFDDQCQ
jgi:hypothetical protein